MATNQMLAALRHLQRDLDARSVQRLSDLDLLRRFVVRRDEAAFAALVGRHGGLVLHVCRRVLDREADVDDAFQATFLVLARKAASIRKRTSLASWLHGVAFRSSMNLRKSVMRRHKHERAAASQRPAEARPVLARLHELQAVLDEEIQRLAEPHRAAFVACCLESKSRAEAASALGWKEGTLASRLAKAREILQKRLAARGVTLSATLGAIGLTQSATSATSATSAAVPAALARGTVDAAIAFAADHTAVSGSVVALAESVLRGMLVTKLKLGSLLMAVAAFGIFSLSGLIARPGNDDVPVKPDAAPKPFLAVAADPPKPEPTRTDVLGDPLPKGAAARLGITRLGDAFTSMAASPDSRTLVTTSRGAIRFLKIGTGKVLDEIDTGDKTHSALAFRPDGKTFITLDQWQRFQGNPEAKRITSLVTWDASTRKPLSAVKLNDPPPQRLLFTPDGKFLLGSRESTVIVIDAGTGKELRRRELGKINSQDQWWSPDRDGFTLSPNGRLAALATSTDVKLWDWQSADSTPRSLPMTRDGRCAVLAFSADGQTLVGRSDHDFGLHVWNVDSGKLLKDWYGHRGLDSANYVAMHPDGKRLVTTHYGEHYSNAAEREGGAYLWNLESGLLEKSFATPTGWGRCAFSPDGRWLIAKSERGAHVLDLETGREVAADPEMHSACIKVIAVSSRGTIATASDDGTVGLWNEQGKLVKKLPISAESVHWSPDGASLLCPNNAGTIDLWDAATGRKRYSVPGRGGWTNRSHSHALTFVGDGSRFLSFAIEDYELREYRTATGKVISVRSLQPKGFDPKYLKQAGGPVDSAGNTIPLLAHCEMTRDGATLLTAEGSRVRLTDTSTGKELRDFETGEQPSFYGSRMSPDGRLLLFDKHSAPLDAHDPWSYSLVWFDLDKGKKIRVMPTVDPPYWPTFSSDGKYAATTNADDDGPRFVQVWDCATGKEVSVFPIPRGSAQSLAFSNDNRKLYTGMSDSSVLIWDLPRR